MRESFERGLASLFGRSTAAVYTLAADGTSVPVQVIRRRADTDADAPSGGFRISESKQAAAAVFGIRLAEVPVPVAGDAIVVDGLRWPVKSADLDETGLVWRVRVGKAEALP